FRLDSVRLLDAIKGSLVSGVTLKVADDMLNPQFAGIINEMVAKCGERIEEKEKGSLTFDIFSPKYNRRISMRSTRKVPLTRTMLQELDKNDIEYEVNRISH
ncbi:MAG: hypothetical protein K2F77_00230, partial [Muribaculaceae bacterium]|nr:hypothetical protein [Muribaculaceae bacterium]